MQADLSVYRTKLDQYLAVGVDTWTMSQCEAVEVQLKSSPEAISKRKVMMPWKEKKLYRLL
jgi:hypothetical protein